MSVRNGSRPFGGRSSFVRVVHRVERYCGIDYGIVECMIDIVIENYYGIVRWNRG